MSYGVFGGRRFIAAMYHAIGAFFIAACAILFPFRGVHQLFEAFGIAFADQIARALPAKDAVAGRAPRRAFISLVATQEIEEERRLAQAPFRHALLVARFPDFEDFAEQVLRGRAIKEMLLIHRAFIGIARRDGHRANADFHHVIEEIGYAFRRRIVEERRVDIDLEALGQRLFDGRFGNFVHARFVDRAIMFFLQTVQMDLEGQIGRGGELVHLLVQEQAVRAHDDIALLCDEACNDLGHVTMDKGFAAGDRHDGCTAFNGRAQAIFNRKTLVEDRCRIIDLAATGASQIATKERLKHQDEWVTFPPHELLLHDVKGDVELLAQRNGHGLQPIKERKLTKRTRLYRRLPRLAQRPLW